MYIPRSNTEDRLDVLHDFIDAHPFAALVTASADGLLATHLPLVLRRDRGPSGTLEGHVARANPHHQQVHMHSPPEALVIFSGPNAYITPSWYPSKSEHGEVVPTWNYVAVHASGSVRFRDDHAFLRQHLEALTVRHERDREKPWGLGDAPDVYINRLERAIVGVEMPITRIQGKWKMSQNRSAADIQGVASGLAASPVAGDREVASIVLAVRPQTDGAPVDRVDDVPIDAVREARG